MKQRLTYTRPRHGLIVLMICLLSIMTQQANSTTHSDGDTFTAGTVEGVEMTFKVISVANKTCQVGNDALSIAKSTTGTLTIPSKVEGFSVISLGRNAFSGCSSLTSVTIPNSVTSIGYVAFENCSSLTSITFPNSVMSIESGAFSGTAWYNNQPDGLVYAGKVAYAYKGTMPANTSITIVDGTLGIAGNAFYGSSNLTSITIPNSVTIIGNRSFWGCSSLTSIAIPNSVTSIGQSVFYNCSSLTSVTIPNSVTSIGYVAFENCI